MKQVVIFGNWEGKNIEYEVNAWLKDNQQVEILEFKYAWDTISHLSSICILYETNPHDTTPSV